MDREKLAWALIAILAAGFAGLELLALDHMANNISLHESYLIDHAERIRALETYRTVCEKCLHE